ncbi:hypothetical protein F5Y10DRAFT_262354 [Nemania abortiva]|nr:hypothetical protein F5Y10DRAFT_262354 [Nemania abortiva]
MSEPSDCGVPVHRPHREGPEPVRTHPVRSEDAQLHSKDALMNKTGNSPDNIQLSRAVVLDIIRHLNREPGTITIDGMDNLRCLQFLTGYGDYAGRVRNDLKARLSGPLGWTVRDDAPVKSKEHPVPTIALEDADPTIYRTIPKDAIIDLFESKRLIADPQAQVSNDYKRMSTNGSGTTRRSQASSDPSTDRLLKRKRSDEVFESSPGKRLCIRD